MERRDGPARSGWIRDGPPAWQAGRVGEIGVEIGVAGNVGTLVDGSDCGLTNGVSKAVGACKELCRLNLGKVLGKAGGGEQKIPVIDFVTGNQRNRLTPGDLLRQIDIPIAALKRRTAFRQISLAPVGRSAALLIGSLDADGTLVLTVTASTVRPIQLSFSKAPDAPALREAIAQQIPDDLYHTDIHGKPLWRKHMTLRLAEEIRGELLGAPPS